MVTPKVLVDRLLGNGVRILIDQRQALFYLLGASYACNLAFFVTFMLVRIPDEERMMRQHFGKAYDEFLAARWRIIPGVM